MKQFAKPVIFILLAFILGYYRESLISDQDFLENFEILIELLTIFASFSIFAVTWIAHNKSRDNHTLFLGMVFLIIGVLDLFYVLSYPFMPDFITANSHQKSIIFWSAARIISALLFLGSVYVHKDTFSGYLNKYVLLICSFDIILFSILAILFYPVYLPLLEYQDGSATILREYLIISYSIIIMLAGYLYSNRVNKTGERNLLFLAYGLIFSGIGDLVYFDLELTGHLFDILAFYCMFIALYKTSVELPYEKLAIMEEKLKNTAQEKFRSLFDNANDAIIIHDLQGFIVSWNNAAQRIFGWTALEATGKELLPLIVPDEFKEKMQKVACTVTSGRTSYLEPVFLKKDGSRIYGSLTVSDLKDADGKPAGIFQQVDAGLSRKYGGAGIGLASSKQLVELHGGKILAKSRYGIGSTFTFTLPLEEKRTVA